MTLRLTRGAVFLLFVGLAAATGWSVRAYLRSTTLQREGLARVEKEKTLQLTRQIAEARQALQQSSGRQGSARRVQQIQNQFTRLLELAKQSKKVSLVAGRKALGSLWMAAGFCLLALVMLSLSLQRTSRRETEPPDFLVKERTEEEEIGWQNVHRPSPAVAVEECYDAALRVAKELYTLSAAPPIRLISRLASLIQKILSVSSGARRRLLHAQIKNGGSLSLGEHAVNVTWLALLRGQAMRLEEIDLLDLGLAGFLHDLAKVPLPSGRFLHGSL